MVSPVWQKLQLRYQQATFGIKQQQAFLEDIASLVEDGVPVNQAVENYALINKEGAEHTLAKSVLEKIAQGKYIADGLVDWYPPAIVEIIRSGEEGGVLAKTLRAAASSLTQRESAFSSLTTAMVYPITVLCMALGVSIFINNSIFASFRAITPQDKWPADAQAVATVATFLQHWWWLLLIAFVLLTYLFIRFLHDYVGEGRQWLDKLPIWSLYRKLTSARLMETMGMLITNGLVLKKALKIAKFKAKPYLASHIMLMEHRLGTGKDNIAEVMDTGLINEADLSRLRLVAMSKGFEHALVRQGQRAADEGMKSIKLTGRIMGGSILAAAAMFAIFMITAVYATGFSVVPGQ